MLSVYETSPIFLVDTVEVDLDYNSWLSGQYMQLALPCIFS